MVPMYSKFASSANEEENRAESRKLHMTLPPILLERPEKRKWRMVTMYRSSYVPTDPGSHSIL